MTNSLRDAFKMTAQSITKRVKQLLLIAPVAALASCGTIQYGTYTPPVYGYTPPDAVTRQIAGGNSDHNVVTTCFANNRSQTVYTELGGAQVTTMTVETRPSANGAIVYGESNTPNGKYTGTIDIDGMRLIKPFQVYLNGRVDNGDDSDFRALANQAVAAGQEKCPLRAYHPYTLISPGSQNQIYKPEM